MTNIGACLHWRGVSQLPITQGCSPRPHQTCYITSLRTAWFDYPSSELRSQPVQSTFLRAAGVLSRLLGIDRVTIIGNHPISTNVLTPAQLREVPGVCIDFAQSFPKHFTAVRNLLPHVHSELIATLTNLGFYKLPARVIYEFDYRVGAQTVRHSHLSRDLSMLRNGGLQTHLLTSVTEQEAHRLADLYRQIYIDKHSTLNAQYTPAFFQDMVEHQTMQLLALKSASDQVLAFAMLHRVGDTLTVPALGYDSQCSIQSLYRQLFAAIVTHAQLQSVLLNYSSGAGDFKRKRGGKAHLEFTLLRPPSCSGFLTTRLLHWVSAASERVNVELLISKGA